jgi:SAM-dependent methyltransferase
MEFDRYRDSYREDMEQAVGFAGASPDLYTEVKASLLIELAREGLGSPEGLRVLDAGCGPGETDGFLAGTFKDLAGVDISRAMIEAAAARNRWADYRHFSPGQKIPFEAGTFDLSFAICVFHHVEPRDRSGFLREIARVTRTGGLIAVFEHNPLNPATRKVVRDCPFDEDVNLLRMGETRELVTSEGLELVDARYILFFPRRSAALRRLERGLRRFPLGAQYYVAARKGATSPPDSE